MLSSVQLHPILCDPMNCSTPGLLVHHQLPEFAQTHVHQVSDAILPSHPLLSPFPPAFNLCQLQGLFQSVSSCQQVAKVLEFQLQHPEINFIQFTDNCKFSIGPTCYLCYKNDLNVLPSTSFCNLNTK